MSRAAGKRDSSFGASSQVGSPLWVMVSSYQDAGELSAQYYPRKELHLPTGSITLVRDTLHFSGPGSSTGTPVSGEAWCRRRGREEAPAGHSYRDTIALAGKEPAGRMWGHYRSHQHRLPPAQEVCRECKDAGLKGGQRAPKVLPTPSRDVWKVHFTLKSLN